MGKLLAAMICLGLAIGLMFPSSEPQTAIPTSSNSSQRLEVVLTRGSTGHFFADAKVNGKGDVNFIVDTGASIVALTISDARKLGISVNPDDFTVVGQGAGGPVRGAEIWLDSVDLGGIKAEKVRAVVLEGSELSLLGQSFLAKVDEVSISGDYLALRDGA